MNQYETREFITEDEFHYLANIFNGVMFSADIPLETQLIAAIDESDPALIAKWSVDADELQTKIRYGYDEHRVILVAKILQHWDRIHYHI